MEVSSPLVQNPSGNGDLKSIKSNRDQINDQSIGNNKNQHHRSSLQMVGQQSQSHHHQHSNSTNSSRHQSSSSRSQERKEEGRRGEKHHVQQQHHLLTQSSTNLLPSSHSSPSLNVINGGKNQTQLSNSTNNFNVMKAEQFEMIRKRQYRVGLNLFNKSPPEVSSNMFILFFPIVEFFVTVSLCL